MDQRGRQKSMTVHLKLDRGRGCPAMKPDMTSAKTTLPTFASRTRTSGITARKLMHQCVGALRGTGGRDVTSPGPDVPLSLIRSHQSKVGRRDARLRDLRRSARVRRHLAISLSL
ncbi:hypothetical protein EVAR_18146_1 [Eumeta japonica]|uniref:Uncharacterized protein n=1 Tax=Eumeta variegata TaxID=151549 RepID=A0A4C1UWE9_EUMVA|nr:hypothetical protein EVAR_18146_1 [Eumeta japonica]